MEATPQATQRKITLESFDLVHAYRPEVYIFNELLVQYPLDPDSKTIGQVVPDNMVVISPEPFPPLTNFSLPFQQVKPFWMFEYVSKQSERKDYEDNFVKYEQHLKTTYYLVFYPDNQDMTLYKLQKGHYVSVKPNKQGRCQIPKLDMEVGLLEGWVRYWYQGKLLPLPAEQLRSLEEISDRLAVSQKQTEEQAQRAEQEQQGRLLAEKELAQLREELARLRKQD